MRPALLLAAAWLGVAARGWAAPPDFGQPVVCPHCNVLLIVLPGLRADSLTPERMPRLTAWMTKHRAVEFSQAVSPSSWYLPALTTMLTGVLPAQHRVFNELPFQGGESPALPDLPNLPKLLRAAGYRAGAFCATGAAEPRFGLDRGFDSFKAYPRTTPLSELAGDALRWSAAGDGPWMALALSFQAQGWRDPESARQGKGMARKWEEFRHLALSQALFGLDDSEARELREYHDGLLRRTDADLVALLEKLPRHMVVVIASTNGEEFGEHGGVDHGTTLYDEALRVPLVVATPGVPHFRVQDHQLSLRETGPMILDFVGVRKSLGPEVPLFNRVDMLQGIGRDEDAVAQTDYLGVTHLDALRSADGWKLIRDRRRQAPPQLYYLVEDPGESRDLARQRPDLVASYGRELDAAVGQETP